MGDVGGTAAASPLSLMSVFEEACPAYMSFGMTYHDYWDGDVKAHKMYRLAKRESVIADNRMAWLQGMYFYEALLDAGKYIKAFSKSKPVPYPDKPYDLFAEERRRREEREQRERYEHIKDKVASFAKAFNEKRKELEEKGVEDDAGCIPNRD